MPLTCIFWWSSTYVCMYGVTRNQDNFTLFSIIIHSYHSKLINSSSPFVLFFSLFSLFLFYFLFTQGRRFLSIFLFFSWPSSSVAAPPLPFFPLVLIRIVLFFHYLCKPYPHSKLFIQFHSTSPKEK